MLWFLFLDAQEAFRYRFALKNKFLSFSHSLMIPSSGPLLKGCTWNCRVRELQDQHMGLIKTSFSCTVNTVLIVHVCLMVFKPQQRTEKFSPDRMPAGRFFYCWQPPYWNIYLKWLKIAASRDTWQWPPTVNRPVWDGLEKQSPTGKILIKALHVLRKIPRHSGCALPNRIIDSRNHIRRSRVGRRIT